MPGPYLTREQGAARDELIAEYGQPTRQLEFDAYRNTELAAYPLLELTWSERRAGPWRLGDRRILIHPDGQRVTVI